MPRFLEFPRRVWELAERRIEPAREPESKSTAAASDFAGGRRGHIVL